MQVLVMIIIKCTGYYIQLYCLTAKLKASNFLTISYVGKLMESIWHNLSSRFQYSMQTVQVKSVTFAFSEYTYPSAHLYYICWYSYCIRSHKSQFLCGYPLICMTILCFSYDGVPFLMHDDTLRRTSNVAELFPEQANLPACLFNLSQIQQLDAGSWFLQVGDICSRTFHYDLLCAPHAWQNIDYKPCIAGWSQSC